MQKLVILKRGGLIFGTEHSTGKIWYSYNEGNKWYHENTEISHFVEIIPIESLNNIAIAAIGYNAENVYSLVIFNFSHVISSLCVKTDRECEGNDFEIWYVPRYWGNCFQGREVSYLKKRASIMCEDNRNDVLRTVKQCPCSFEDFLCKPNYIFKNNFCVLDPLSNYTEANKTCQDEGIPLSHFNGFGEIDSNKCSLSQINGNEYSSYSQFCISKGNSKV
ncbi:Sortilin [Thelohanellus kitauei]|uniref:Sortilin n=1 Tax=Thelohanellus kitauei TaxID=669202 RepID=A0A0C2MU23_THEKT|nr:Sortilin [Thelohanellus kitauei]